MFGKIFLILISILIFGQCSQFQIFENDLILQVFPDVEPRLDWLYAIVHYIFNVLMEYVYSKLDDPINVNDVYIDINYGSLLSLKGVLEDVQFGINGLNITLVEFTLTSLKVLVETPGFFVAGLCREASGKIFSFIPYTGTTGLRINVNQVLIGFDNGAGRLEVLDAQVSLDPIFSAGSLTLFAFMGIFLFLIPVGYTLFSLGLLVKKFFLNYKQKKLQISSEKLNRQSF